jgi:hypothetical protein
LTPTRERFALASRLLSPSRANVRRMRAHGSMLCAAEKVSL